MSLNKKQLLKASSISLDDDDGKGLDESPAARPRTAPGQLMGLQSQYQKAVEQVDALKEEIKSGPFRMLPLDALSEVPGRRRKLTEQEFAELRDNLSQHTLVTPITVRRIEGGRFEIVSGHNRVAAYRELERTEIASWIADAPESQGEELAFYANLLHPSLPDFEKYLGLRKIVAANGSSLSDAELAKRTGMSEALIWQLRQFDRLPQEALELLETRPEKLGSRIATKLAALSDAGKAEEVVEAVRHLVSAPNVDQKAALAMASANEAPAPRKQATRIRYGNKIFCTVQSSPKAIRLTFESDEDRVEAEQLVAALLKQQAAKKK
jgi:ParB family chromosome partitioning protein